MHAEEALRDYVIEADRAGEAITPPSAIERESSRSNPRSRIPFKRNPPGGRRTPLTGDPRSPPLHYPAKYTENTRPHGQP